MKKLFLVLIVCVFSLNILSQKSSGDSINKSLVTKSMSNKITNECLLDRGYLYFFYNSNSKLISERDIISGKGREIILSLEKYPKHSENFIRELFKAYGYIGLKNIGFTDDEIIISKKIINKIRD